MNLLYAAWIYPVWLCVFCIRLMTLYKSLKIWMALYDTVFLYNMTLYDSVFLYMTRYDSLWLLMNFYDTVWHSLTRKILYYSVWLTWTLFYAIKLSLIPQDSVYLFIILYDSWLLTIHDSVWLCMTLWLYVALYDFVWSFMTLQWFFIFLTCENIM